MHTQTSKFREANTFIAQDILQILAPSSPVNSLYASEIKPLHTFPHHFHSFLMHIYNSLHYRTNKKVDMFTLSDLSGYPLLFCEKAANYITKGKHKHITSEEFIQLFKLIYFESILNKTQFAASLFDFKKKDHIFLSDVKVLLLHFHMRIFNDSSEKQVIEIIENFFGHRIQMSRDMFIRTCLEKNFDIIHLLYVYLEKYKPFDQEQFQFFQEIQSKSMYQSNLITENTNNNTNNVGNNNNIRQYSNENTLNTLNTLTPSKLNNTALLDLGNNYFQSQTLKADNIKGTEICTSPTGLKGALTINRGLHLTTIARTTTTSPPSKKGFHKNEIFNYQCYANLDYSSIEQFISHKAKLYAKTVLAIPMRYNELNDQEDNEMKAIMEVFDVNYKNTTLTLKKANDNNQHLSSTYGRGNNKERSRSQKIRCSKKEAIISIRDCEYDRMVHKFFKTKEKISKEMRLRLNYYDDYDLNQHKTFSMATNSYMKTLSCGNKYIYNSNNTNGLMVASTANSLNNGYSTNCESVYNNTEDISVNNNNNNNNNNNANNVNIVNPLSKKEILVYKLNKNRTKYKSLKLIVISNMIFYYTKNIQSKYQFKRIIMITHLYPKLLRTCSFPPNVIFPSVSNNPNPKIFQLQLVSSLHSFLSTLDLYFTNKESLDSFINHLVILQNIRNLEKAFTFGEELGAGRFGKVVVGKHKLTKELYAIKSVDKYDENQCEENYKCYMWEKDIFIFLKGVNDNHIEKCYDYYETPEHVFYIKEIIPGGDLKTLINKNYFDEISENKISLINNLTRQMLQGLQRLHHYGIIHRDIKHTNMLVNIKSTKDIQLKIIDFGLSKVMGYNEYAMDHYGSLSFKSPELVAGSKYSFNVDIWAIGITVYYLIYSTYPIKADNKQDLKKLIVNFHFDPSVYLQQGTVKDYMNKIIINALIRDPKQRPNINQMIKITNDEEILCS